MKNYIHCHFTGALRSEKIEMTAQLKKQQARIQYLEGLVEKLNKEVCLFSIHFEKTNHKKITSFYNYHKEHEHMRHQLTCFIAAKTETG